jgi:putative transposase
LTKKSGGSILLNWTRVTTGPFFEGGAAVGKSYKVVEGFDKKNLAEFLVKEGQFLLPVVEAIQEARQAIDEVIDVVAGAAVEAVLVMSAEEVAGKRSQGMRKSCDVYWHGSQSGRVRLSDRKMKVSRPRLRRKVGGEVEVPAYSAMQRSGLAGRMYEILVSGVTTRKYKRAIREMADTAGVSRSAVSREFVDESGARLEELCGRRFEGLDILVVYVDGIVFGGHHVVAAVGVDNQGGKRLLGLILAP